MRTKGTIAILTGGGDVPGLNPAIRAVTIRAHRDGYRVLGIRRGWGGLIDVVPDAEADNSAAVIELTPEVVRKVGRSGGTFLHSSRVRPSHLARAFIPAHLQDRYREETNDITPEILRNIEFLGIDTLIAIGGDDTLSYAHRLHVDGANVIAIPKTMDNDVPGTDYCIGFSTCVTRTIELTHRLRTSAGSHERILVIEVFGRYAGYTALVPAMAGASDRCVIPESPFDVERLTELLVSDRSLNPSHYSVVLVSEGATMTGHDEMTFSDSEADPYGHKKLGGIGDRVAAAVGELSSKYNNGREVHTTSQRLGYLVRSGDPDALDSIVPMAFGNLALDLVEEGKSGLLVAVRNGVYDSVPIEAVVGEKKAVDLDQFYSVDRMRPLYTTFANKPLFIMTSA